MSQAQVFPSLVIRGLFDWTYRGAVPRTFYIWIYNWPTVHHQLTPGVWANTFGTYDSMNQRTFMSKHFKNSWKKTDLSHKDQPCCSSSTACPQFAGIERFWRLKHFLEMAPYVRLSYNSPSPRADSHKQQKGGHPTSLRNLGTHRMPLFFAGPLPGGMVRKNPTNCSWWTVSLLASHSSYCPS